MADVTIRELLEDANPQIVVALSSLHSIEAQQLQLAEDLSEYRGQALRLSQRLGRISALVKAAEDASTRTGKTVMLATEQLRAVLDGKEPNGEDKG